MNKLELAKLLASVFQTPVSQAADDTDELVRKGMNQGKKGQPLRPRRPDSTYSQTTTRATPKSPHRTKRADK